MAWNLHILNLISMRRFEGGDMMFTTTQLVVGAIILVGIALVYVKMIRTELK